jgi:hyperosmotically inducible protein
MVSRHVRIGTVFAVCAVAMAPGGVALAQTAPAPQPSPASRPTESRDAKTAVTDSWITAKTKIALLADERVSGTDVSVTTTNGIVTLNGNVDTSQAKAAAEQVARDIDGVRQVQNNLQVVPRGQRSRVDARDDEIAKRVEQQIDQDSRLGNSNIGVAVNNGAVRLTGDVETIGMSAAASDAARRVAGVRSVRNEITVKRDDRMRQDPTRADERLSDREPAAGIDPYRGGRAAPDRQAMRDGTAREDRANGVSRDLVRRVQEALKDKGHDPGSVDGVLGPQTQQAIRDFQRAENLPTTGRLDGQTLSRLAQ